MRTRVSLSAAARAGQGLLKLALTVRSAIFLSWLAVPAVVGFVFARGAAADPPGLLVTVALALAAALACWIPTTIVGWKLYRRRRREGWSLAHRKADGQEAEWYDGTDHLGWR